MSDDTSRLFVVGAFLGGATALVAWILVSKTIDAKIAAGSASLYDQVDAQLPAKVQDAVQKKLNEVNLTPATGRQISALLNTAERLRLI